MKLINLCQKQYKDNFMFCLTRMLQLLLQYYTKN